MQNTPLHLVHSLAGFLHVPFQNQKTFMQIQLDLVWFQRCFSLHVAFKTEQLLYSSKKGLQKHLDPREKIEHDQQLKFLR